MDKKILYFAYGSNMCTGRLLSRISSAKPIGRGRLLNKRLVCNKKSKDGSGKANLEDSPGNVVWGLLYEIDSSDLNKLDKAEEEYQRVTMYVRTNEGKLVQAQVYISKRLTKAIPFDWYKEMLISGAVEHQLPEEYIDFLRHLTSKRDPDRD